MAGRNAEEWLISSQRRWINPKLARDAGSYALKHAEAALSSSEQQHIARYRWSDLEVGELLGMGAFSHVYEVVSLKEPQQTEVPAKPQTSSNDDSNDDDMTDAEQQPHKKNPAAAFLEAHHNVSRWVSEQLRKLPPSPTDCLSSQTDEEEEEQTITSAAALDHDDDNEEEGVAAATEAQKEEMGDTLVDDESGSTAATFHSSSGEVGFAVKFLQDDVMVYQDSFRMGAADLALEAKILRSLEPHDNIINLHGISSICVSEAFLQPGGYFLVLERLHSTLDDRIQDWQAHAAKIKAHHRLTLIPVRGDSSAAAKKRVLFRQRLQVAQAICRGMEYLHEHSFLYRDLKPANIGFDVVGQVKIFDFGLCRMYSADRKLTPNTGSLRYMAPEVARREQYDLKADVYSFAILLWELCSLQKPYHRLTKKEHTQNVVYGGQRPKLEHGWSLTLQSLLTRAWAHRAEERPSFAQILPELERELAISNGDRPEQSNHGAWIMKRHHHGMGKKKIFQK